MSTSKESMKIKHTINNDSSLAIRTAHAKPGTTGVCLITGICLILLAAGSVVQAQQTLHVHAEEETHTGETRDANMDGEGDNTRNTTNKTFVTGTFSNAEDHRAAVVVFKIPELPDGQGLASSDFQVYLDGIAGAPDYPIDLWIARISNRDEVLGTDYGIGDGFEDQTLVMENLVTPASPPGWLTLDEAARKTLKQWLHDNYWPGSYFALRLTARTTPDEMADLGGGNRYKFRASHPDYRVDGGNGTEPALTLATEDNPDFGDHLVGPDPGQSWTVPGTVRVTWIGNSLPRGAITNDERSHGQLNIWGIEVSDDGRVYAGGHNESGHAISVYKDGDLESDFIPKTASQEGGWNWGTSNKGAVSFDEDFMYSINGGGIVNKWTRKPPYEQVMVNGKIETPANEIVVRHNRLYLVGYEGKSSEGEIQIRNLDDDFSLISRFNVPGAYDIAVENENSIWVSLGGKDGAANEVRNYDAEGNRLPGALDGFGKLMGISIGNHQGHLIVADDGPDKQVLFYDISDPANPVLTREFGEKGGILSGNRGVFDNDLKFYDVQDAGTDAEGNIYTLFSVSPLESSWNGNMIRKYSPDGEKIWELSTHFGCQTASVLPSTDGEEIYGVEEVFKLDPNAGNTKSDPSYRHGFGDPDWKIHAMSKNDISNPDELREKRQAYGQFIGSAEAREINGKRVVFRQDMGSNSTAPQAGYDLFVFEDRPSMISHNKGQIQGNKHAWYPDLDGNVWEGNAGNDTIRMHEFGGFDSDGNPVYEEYEEYEYPEWFAEVTRIFYDTENDVLYLSGYSEESLNDERWPHGRLPVNVAGTHLLRYNDWKQGNRQPSYAAELPWDGSGRSLPPKTWYKAGDYIFTAPVRPKDGVILISVIDAHSGELEGTMNHHEQFGQTGWVDITRGLTAFQRSNGEYIVIVEDNGFSKNIVYRWNPGD